MIGEKTSEAKSRMDDTIKSLKRDLDSISTGRANPALLDTVKIEVYGSQMPISQLASISVPEPTTLAVQVWDKENVKATEKAIINANLGFTPLIDGQLIRINLPKLSQERRVELVKLSKKYGEDKKVAIRNIRRDILDDAKKSEKEDSGISKDQIHALTDSIQKVTDDYVAKIDEEVVKKEKELMSV